jgi:type VI secretion system protein ImpC
MSRATISTGGITFPGQQDRQPASLPEDTPMHIALLADFSGRANTGDSVPSDVATRRVIRVDRDNFEDVFSSLGVKLRLPIAENPITFNEFDDLHPDYLYERLPLFSDLRQLKRRLKKPDEFGSAAEEIRQWGLYRARERDQESATPAGAESRTGLSANLLDSVLSASSTLRYENTSEDNIDRLIKDIVAPYIEAKADPDLPTLLAAVDEATGELMRKVCHASAFQQLEASWRAVHLLVRRLETDSQLVLHLVDVAREELLEDLAGCNGDLERSGIFQLLVERTKVPGATPFAIINADYFIGDSGEDIELASALAAVGAAIGAGVCCGGRTSLAGCEDISESADPADWSGQENAEWATRWATLRARPEAAHLALAAPRFLLRLPYGPRTSPIESFNYKELPADGDHRYYLWGNSAYLVTLLLALGFQRDGWSFQPGQLSTAEDFPLHVYTDAEGEEAIKPCAEVMLTDSAATRLTAAGLLPVRSIKGTPHILIPRFPALAADTVLAGPW